MRQQMFTNSEEITIKSEFITLGQFLHFAKVINTGGMAKVYLLENEVLVNGKVEQRRGRKLYPDDTIFLGGKIFVVKRE